MSIPRRLKRFLRDQPDAEFSVHEWGLLGRLHLDELPPSLEGIAPLPVDLEYGVSDFSSVIHLTRSARVNGAAHVLIDEGEETYHLSVVPTVDRAHLIFVRHPDAGIGEVEEMTAAPLIFRGVCDNEMLVTALDENCRDALNMQEPDGSLRLTALVDADSVDDLIDCWIDSVSMGASSCSVQLRHQAEDLDDWFQLTLFQGDEKIEFVIINTADNLRARRVQEARNRLRNISETIPHGIFRIAENGHVIYKNSKIVELFGDVEHVDWENLKTSEDEPLAIAVPRLLAEDEEAQFEVRTKAKGVERISRIRVRMVPSLAGGVEFVGSLEDVTADVERAQQLEQEALTDPMTGAANRRALESSLAELLDDSTVDSFAVMLLDLDGFKQVNDSLGHGAGDRVIAEFGRRLIDACRSADLVARLGGDEFVMIVRDVRDYDRAMEFANRLLPIMRAPFILDDTTIELSGSIGVAMAEKNASVRSVLQMADHAMYEAKRAGRNQARPYHCPDSANPVSPLALRRDLRRAISTNGLDLAFQPIFDIDDLVEPQAAEALLRWDHSTLGAVDPSTIISIAEQSGLMSDLGEWIVNEAVCAAAQINSERGADYPPISINVNVSALQVGRPDFVDGVALALDVNNLDPQNLTIELTESYLIDQLSDGRVALDAITDMGVRLAIDDFGTGFSTFEYLITMPVYSVKIDPSFTRRLSDPRGRAMLGGLTQACRELDMLVIVEGVETPEQLIAARDAGATHAQGYLLGKPVRSRNPALSDAQDEGEAA